MLYNLGLSYFASTSVELIKTLCPSDGYYVGFSGGKDSIVTLDLIRKSGVKYDAHYQVTTVDPANVVRFIRDEYPEVIFERPRISMLELIKEKRILPTRLIRYCCAELKERGGDGRTVVTGIRAEESSKRGKRKQVETCFKNGNKRYVHPIFHWGSGEVWEYIHNNKLKYPSQYDNGYKRIGCVACPMATKISRLIQLADNPKIKQIYDRAIQYIIDNDSEHKAPYRTLEEAYKWWIF